MLGFRNHGSVQLHLPKAVAVTAASVEVRESDLDENGVALAMLPAVEATLGEREREP